LGRKKGQSPLLSLKIRHKAPKKLENLES